VDRGDGTAGGGIERAILIAQSEGPVQPTKETDPILELLVEWDELRRQGKTPTLEDLCPGDPERQAQLQERLAKRQRMQALVDLPDTTPRVDTPESAALPVIVGFAIGELLGRGGMGLVYKAQQIALKRTVALKMVLSGAHASAAERTRFRTEAEAVAQLQHPNIVQIYEVGEQAGCPYLALEFVGGGSLAQHLNGKPLAPRRAAELVLDLARAVQHAHEHGIVHRDLKPANVLLTESGVAKITDFGLAKRLDADSSQTQTGAVLGSPSYMAPEQAEGKVHAIGPRTDVYALGAVLYELLSGRPPFLGASVLETLEQVRSHDPAPPQTLQPKVSADLATICLKCLEKAPAQRYPSAAALAQDLDLYLRGEPITARQITPVEQVARILRHNRVDASLGAYGTLVLWLAPIPLLVHASVFVFCRHWPLYPIVSIGVTMVTVLLLLYSILFTRIARVSLVGSSQRRQFLSTWAGHIVGFLLIPIAIVRMVQPVNLEQWFVIYALCLIQVGCTFFTFAATAGFLFITGICCFLLSLLIPWAPSLAPLLIGTLMSVNMTVQGIMLRRLAKESAGDAGFQSHA
jgi:serine/threonine protein kinase